jgi:hypothetical protein
MPGFWGELIQGLFGNDYLRDYTHASKTFRPNGYQNAPKHKFLFHVYFEINPDAYAFSGGNFGLLVKDIQLPIYRFDVKEYNQYNRKRLVQTKINYEPVQITFHDDNGSQITDLWHAYYTYYYGDGRIPDSGIFDRDQPGGGEVFALNTGGIESQNYDKDFTIPNLYNGDLSAQMNWGYIGESNFPQTGVAGQRLPFFKNVTVYGFSQHSFVAYTLINPIITEFQHDRYNYDEGNGVMKHNMTLAYETVVYNTGYIDGRTPDEIVTGFGTEANYDREVSPITKIGYNGLVLGQGGLIDAIGGAFKRMESDPYNAWKDLGKIYNQAKREGLTKGSTFKNQARNDAWQQAIDAAIPKPYGQERRVANPFDATIQRPRNPTYDFPVPNTSTSTIGQANQPTIGQRIPSNNVVNDDVPTNNRFIESARVLPAPLEPVFFPTIEPDVVRISPIERPIQPPTPIFRIPSVPLIQAYVPQPEITAGIQINSVAQGPPTELIPQQVSFSGIAGYPTSIGLGLGGGLTPNQFVVNSGGGGGRNIEFTQNNIQDN